jgi:PAS domain S-box-containing protein
VTLEMNGDSSETVFRGGGKVGALLRARFTSADSNANGSQTSIGTVENWSQSLKLTLNILLNACSPTFLLWGNDRILFYNDAYLSLAQARHYPLGLGEPIGEVKSDEWRTLQSNIEQVFRSGQPLQREQQSLPSDQKDDRAKYCYTWSFTPIWQETGQVEGVFVSGCRVLLEDRQTTQSDYFEGETALQRTPPHLEETLNRREEQLQLITNAIPALISYVDKNHYYRFANQTYETWFGILPSEPINKHVCEFLGEAAYQAVLPYMDQVLSGQRVSFESQIPYRIGGTRYVSVEYVPHVNNQGEVEGYFSLVTDITQRKQAEEELRESEARIQLAMKIGRLGSWRYDPATDVVELDDRMREIWGESDNTVLIPLSRVVERIHPEDREQVTIAISHALDPASSGTYDIDYRIVWNDGTEHWVSANGQVQFAEEGATRRPAGFIGTALDITERKQAEAEQERLLQTLAAERARFEAVLRQMPEGVMIADAASGNLVLSNEQANQILRHAYSLNLELEQYELRVPFQAYYPDGRPYAAAEYPLVRSLRTGEVIWHEEMEIRYQDNSHILIDTNSAPVFDRQGHIISAVAVFQDITQRKETEQALREAEERLRVALQNAPISVFNQDHELKYTWIYNPALYNLSEMLGKHDRDYLPTEDAETLTAIKQRVLDTGIGIREEIKITRDAATHYYDLTVEPLRDADNTIVGITCAAVDISKPKQAEIDLRESEERLRLAMDGAQMGTWDVNLVTGKAIWSELHFTVLGYDPTPTGEASEAMWNSRIHPDDLAQVMQEWQQSQQECRLYRMEYRVVRADNQQVSWLAALGRFTYDHTGKAIRSIGVLFDITDRKRTEMALVAQEQRYRYIFEAVNVSIWEEDFSEVKAAIDQLRATGVQDFRQYFADHPEFVQQAVDMVHLRDVNQRSLHLFGAQDKAELLNSLHRIFVPETQDVFIEELLAIAAERTYFAAETVLQTLQGNRFHVWFAIAFPPPSAPYDRVLVSLLDISDRVRIEAALRESEARFRGVVESNMVGIFFWDASGCITDGNDMAVRMLGYSREELQSRQIRWSDITPSEFQEIDAAMQAQLLAEGVCPPFEKAYIRKDKVQVPILIGGALIPGYTDRGVAYFIDITDRKQAEENLRLSEHRYRTLAHAVAQLMWVNDARGNIKFYNQRWQEYTGMNELELGVGLWAEIIHPDDFAATSAKRTKAIQAGEAYEVECRLKRADQTYRWHLARVVPFKDEQGQILYWFGTATDIDDRKRAEQEREQLLIQAQAAREAAETANRIKDEFLAVVSHELRSPLNPILGWAKLLRSHQLDQQKTEHALEVIERNAQMQAQLINDLLDVSRILRGKLSLQNNRVDLLSTIQAAMETVHLAAAAKTIDLQFTTVDADLENDEQQTAISPIGQQAANSRSSTRHSKFIVSGDPNRLQQVIWNLLSNAVKFTAQGGRIAVRLEQIRAEEGIVKENGETLLPLSSTTYAQITVTDTGKGIHPDFLPHVFDHFRQEDSATTRRFGGLGLGLAIVRYLVELHGGTVHADSPGEGLGATFTVKLPLVESRELATTNGENNAISPRSNLESPITGLRMLVVDDDTSTREFLAFLLELHGANVMAVTTASEAIVTLTQFKPDMLLSDVGMPDMDGYMMMRQIRTLPPEQGGTIPAIALTAYAGENDYRQAISAGFQRHLAKPIEPQELLEVITELRNSGV